MLPLVVTGLHDIAVWVLLAVSAAFGVPSQPGTSDPGWTIIRPWEADGGRWVTEARSQAIVDACRADPAVRIEFPRIILGAQRVTLDGTVIATLGDPTMAASRSFFGTPDVGCADVVAGHELGWTAWSGARYFARTPFFPRLTARPRVARFFEEVLPLLAAGSLLPGGFFCLLMFRRIAPAAIGWSLLMACLGFGSYCLASVVGRLGVDMSVATAQRIGGAGIAAGTLAFATTFWLEGLVRGGMVFAYGVAAIVALALLAVAPSQDVAQFAILLPMPVAAVLLCSALVAAVRRAGVARFALGSTLEVASLAIFVALLVHDAFLTVGVATGPPVGPIGILGGVIFFTLAVHGRVMAAYRERDFLRAHLEAEVERHTALARRRTDELTVSLEDLRRAQSQLVHSEKMASLGVLVAGVAHELNNPISFIANNVTPLQQLVGETLEATRRGARDAVVAGLERIAQVVDVMRRGAERTAGIVADLRSFSRRGTGETAVVDVHEGLDVSLRLLRPRWAGRLEVVRDYGPPLQVHAPCGELNQVMMNLLANACDAVPGTGHVWIRTRVGAERLEITVQDDGVGIAAADLPRIFDPFFTTKAPGSGTGLGLAVSHGIVSRLGGTIAVSTAPGVGTSMTVLLPRSMLVRSAGGPNGDPPPSTRDTSSNERSLTPATTAC